MTEGFLLAGTSSGETQILDQGKPVEVRQKFKSLIADSDDHDFVWIRYFSDYGDVKKKVFKKRILKSFDEIEAALTEDQIELSQSYTGDDFEAPKKRTAKKKGK